MRDNLLHIVQVVREIHPFGGSSGVAYAMKEVFDRKGINNSVISHTSHAPKDCNRTLLKLWQLSDVITFSIIGTYKIRKLRNKNCVVIVHNEALGGDIYIDHGLHKAIVRQKPSMFLRNPIHLFLFIREEIRHLISGYSYVVTLSEYASSLFLQHYPGVNPNVLVRIPNGIDLDRFSLARVESWSGLRLIYIGHEYERKGLKFVIDALVQLPKDVTLTVIGGTTAEISSYSSIAQGKGVLNRIRFLGKQSNVEYHLSNHDLLVLPSRYESWGLVYIEAMAAGVPVLGTAVGCVPEVVREGETGFVIRQDARNIAEKVKLVYDDRVKLEEMRLKARAMAEEFSWDRIGDLYINLARRVLAERALKKS